MMLIAGVICAVTTQLVPNYAAITPLARCDPLPDELALSPPPINPTDAKAIDLARGITKIGIVESPVQRKGRWGSMISCPTPRSRFANLALFSRYGPAFH